LGALWDRLALISCWSDCHAARALASMRRRFPDVEVQGKGLLATEGVVSIPLFEAHAPVAAVASHFLEFLPLPTGSVDSQSARTVDQLDVGESYEVALTTSGGLYRYRLRDVVRVVGHLHQTPMLTFVGRGDRACDLAGEKLTPIFVERVLGVAMRTVGVRSHFALLAPAWAEPPRYQLYVEATPREADALALEVETLLAESHHYALCRALGQLGPVRAVSVRDGERTFERVCIARGQRAGAIKATSLDADLGWERHFAEIASHDGREREAFV
jgi:hypothetical protein